MEKETFRLETENEILNCEVLLRFFSPKYQKHYLIYTDHSKDDENEENLFISSYNPEDESFELADVLDTELQDIIKELEKIGSE